MFDVCKIGDVIRLKLQHLKYSHLFNLTFLVMRRKLYLEICKVIPIFKGDSNENFTYFFLYGILLNTNEI